MMRLPALVFFVACSHAPIRAELVEPVHHDVTAPASATPSPDGGLVLQATPTAPSVVYGADAGGLGLGVVHHAGGLDLDGDDTLLSPTATVRLGTPKVSGGLGSEVVQRVVGQHVERLKACYQDALRTHPGLEGQVVISFVVDSHGDVSKSEDRPGTTLGGWTLDCITRAVTSISFPAPFGGDANITYLINFSH